MAYIQILTPIILALFAIIIPSNYLRPWILPVAGVIHTFLTVLLIFTPKWCYQNTWLVLDPVGKIILVSISLLFLVCSIYAVGYLHFHKERINRIFVACLLAFIGLLTLVIWSHHMGLMWVAIEGTTLMTAPLIYFRKSPHSLEATWKYLMVGSVGVALALLGTFFLAYASIQGGLDATLDFQTFLIHAPELSKPWLHAAFILLLVGYGTKMGLAPMHTWKPEAYGEAPGIVGALLAGGITSGAFLALTRIWQICNAAGEVQFASRLLIFMGLFSMIIAGIFLINQRDFKRMLAYSSVEHMGILTLGLGIGPVALFGTLFHVMTSTMTEGMMFLSAGNINRAFESKSTKQVMGALRRVPLSGAMFLIGFLAITGTPPFGPFASEFLILNAAFTGGYISIGFLYLFLMFIIFVGMSITVLKVVHGEVPKDVILTDYKDDFLTSMPIVLMLIIILIYGIILPDPLRNLLNEAVKYMSNPL